MQEKYYTTEQAANLLKIHPKTMQRYIREGKLRANKVGKSWLITGHDLSIFAEGTRESAEEAVTRRTLEKTGCVKFSAVADIEVYEKDDAIRIMNALTAAMNCKPPEYGTSSLQVQYIEQERKVRVMLWGSPKFMEALTGFISSLTDAREE